jgi:hypothetical protein
MLFNPVTFLLLAAVAFIAGLTAMTANALGWAMAPSGLFILLFFLSLFRRTET